MNVMRFNFNAALDAPALIAGAAPAPEPGPGEILVRVFAAGVTPTELLWYPTTHTRDGSKRSGAPPVRGGLPARHGKTRCRLCGRLA